METDIGKPKDSPYQYWFFKLNATPLALLVDWILRPTRAPYLRASVQSVTHPQVILREGALSSPQHAWIRIGDAELAPTHTRGKLGELAWDLTIAPQSNLLHPTARLGIPGRILPLSMRLFSYPAVRFRGRLTYRGETWEGEAWGAIAHYWGHALPRHWFWLNAPVDPDSSVYVEALIAEQRLRGLPWPYVRTGYFWLHHQGREHLILHPFTGHLDIWGPPDTAVLRAVPWHGEGFSVHCRAHPKTWQKLGDDIINALTGQARILGVGDCYGRAAIEWRRPPIY